MLEVLEFSAASSTGSDPMERHPAAAGELSVSDCRRLPETYGRPREGPRPGGGRCEVEVSASLGSVPHAFRLKVADMGMVEASGALFPMMAA